MKHNGNYFFSTVGRKQLVALTGLGLSFFVLTHMAGNMLILVSAQKYNEYGHAIITNPFIEVAEIGLVVAFLAHLTIALGLQLLNWRARPEGYAVSGNGDKRTTLTSKTMWQQGLVIFVFLVLHLATFKYGDIYMVNYGHGEIRDLHRLVLEVFNQPGYVAWYVFSMLILGFHLSHGIKSAAQTWGIHHPRYQGALKCFSWSYAVIVAGGFISQPVGVFFFNLGK